MKVVICLTSSCSATPDGLELNYHAQAENGVDVSSGVSIPWGNSSVQTNQNIKEKVVNDFAVKNVTTTVQECKLLGGLV